MSFCVSMISLAMISSCFVVFPCAVIVGSIALICGMSWYMRYASVAVRVSASNVEVEGVVYRASRRVKNE